MKVSLVAILGQSANIRQSVSVVKSPNLMFAEHTTPMVLELCVDICH